IDQQLLRSQHGESTRRCGRWHKGEEITWISEQLAQCVAQRERRQQERGDKAGSVARSSAAATRSTSSSSSSSFRGLTD
ncbi:unnamed protein product, partial [Tetraodon nigroviridis]